MRKEAVLPVPFFALARMSRPSKAIGMASSWIGRGTLEALLVNAHKKLAFQEVVLELVSFSHGDILHGSETTKETTA